MPLTRNEKKRKLHDYFYKKKLKEQKEKEKRINNRLSRHEFEDYSLPFENNIIVSAC